MQSQDVHPEVLSIADRLRTTLLAHCDDRLLGLYLFGSAVIGGYEPGISDVDTVAALSTDTSDEDIAALAAVHEAIGANTPEWRDRIEVVYASRGALHVSLRGTAPAARISPGERFHRIEIDPRWVLDWYPVLTYGRALWGPPPAALLPPISRDEFIAAVRRQMAYWPERAAVELDMNGRSYAILTVSRGWRLVTTGDHVSKREAADWAARELPEYEALIRQAVKWRSARGTIQDGPDLAETRRFVETVFSTINDAAGSVSRESRQRRGTTSARDTTTFNEGSSS